MRVCQFRHSREKAFFGKNAMVGRGGFEPPKSVTADLQSAPFGHSGTYPRLWSWRWDLNPQPADYKSAALPIELHQHHPMGEKMATRKGLEPSTSSVTGWHSKPTELPGRVMVGLQGLEPRTNRL